jgi:hypothetical protein
LRAEIKEEIEMEYGLLERANLLWKALEQMFGSSDDKRSSSTNILENVSSSSIHIDQDQEEQSSVQKEKVKYVSLGKLDRLVSQTGVSDFSRTETSLVEEEDCSTSSSDDDNDDDDTDDEYDYEELLLEFKKLISKHMKLQKRHEDLLCFHKELIDSYALLESTHKVMATKVKIVNHTLAHVHHILLIYLVLTFVAHKQIHHVMRMYL